MITYRLDESVLELFDREGKLETLYKYLSTTIVTDILRLNPARVGAEITIPRPGEDYPREPVPSRWGSALLVNIPGGRHRFDVLGILDERTLVVVEVKNMGAIRDFSEFKEEVLSIVERTESLQKLLNDARGPGVLVALVSAFNGGRSGGGVVASSFAAAPYLKPVGKVERVKFVLVMADVDRAAVFVYDARLGDLMDVEYLERVARRIYDAYRQMPWGDPRRDADFYKSVDNVVDEVVDRYSQYAPVVRLLK